MATVLSFDSFVRKRKEAALEEAKAKEAFLKAVTEGFATKDELEELRAKLNDELARIRAELKAEIAELKAAVAAVERNALLSGIALNCLIAIILKLG